MEQGGTIVWILDADSSKLQSALRQASQSAKDTASSFDQTTKDISKSFENKLSSIGDSLSSIGNKMSLYVTAPISAGFAKAINDAGSFQSSLSFLKQVSGATDSQLQTLSATALKLGADSRFAGVTAQDTANVMITLSKAGLSVNDTLAGTEGVLALAKAGNLDFANAANIAASAMNAFNLEGKDLTRVADALAAGANASQADLGDLGLALQQSSNVSKLFGISLNDNVTALSLFANAGIRSSDAGTSLKSALLQLATPSKQQADMMKQIGFSAYDAAGNFVGLREMSIRLQAATKNLTEEQKQNALGIIFGSDGIRAASVLVADAGKTWDDMAGKVSGSGTAMALASAQLGPYQRNMENFKNSLATLSITLGEKLLPAATSLITTLTNVVNGFAALDPGVQSVILKFAFFVATIGPALKIMGSVASTTASAIKGVSIAINGAKTAAEGFKLAQAGIGMAGAQGNVWATLGVGIQNFVKLFVGIPGLIRGALAVIPGIISGAGSAIMGALAAIPVVGWIILIVAAIVGLFTYFYNTSEGFRNFVNGILGAVGKAISDFAGGVVKFFKPIGEAIMGAFNGVADFIGGVFKTIGDIVSTAFGVISAGVGIVMNVLKPLFQIIGFIGYAIYGFGQIVFTVFSTIFQVIYTIVSTIVQIIGVILYGTLLKIGQFFTWIFTNIGAVVTTVFTAVSGFIMTIWNGIVAFLTPILTAIGNFFTTIFNAIYSTITTVMGAIWAFIEPAINAISAVFTTVFNAVAGVVSAVFEKIKTYIINPIATVVKYVGDTIGKIATFIGDAVKKAYDTVAGWINSFTSAGKNIIDGIVQGMKNAGDAVVNFIKNVCSNALNAVKNFFGIKSPSKVMAKMGEYLMQGFGNGIDREGSVAVKAATNAAEGVLGAFDGMQASVGNMQTQFGVTNTMAAGNIAPVTVDTANATSANGVTINQTNQVYSDVDMEQVNRNLTWELGKL